MKKKLLLVIALALVMVLALSAVALAADIGYVDVYGLAMPVAGQTLDTNVSSSGSGYTVYAVEWTDTSTGQKVPAGTAAIAGRTYKYAVRIKANSGNLFPYIYSASASDPRWQLYSEKAYLNNKLCSGRSYPGPYALVYASNDNQFRTLLDIYGSYTVPASSTPTKISYVKVTGFSMPEVGSSLDFSASPYNSTYSISSIDWYDKTTNSGRLSSSYKAEAGHKYQYFVNVRANEGYEFPYIANSNGSGYQWQFFDGDAYLNSEYCGMSKDPGPYSVVLTSGSKRDMQIVGYYTATVAPGIDNIALTVDAPVIGAKPADTFNAVNKTNSIAVGPESIFWQEKTDAGYWRAISTVKFVQGVQYQVQMVVKPSSGCFAGAENSTARVNTYTGSLTINGSKPKAGSYDVFATGEDGTSYARCLVVTYDFPALGTLPVITEQPKTIYDAKVGGNAVFTVKATGDDLHYKWYGGTDASPTPLGGDAPELTLTNLTQKNNNTDFWCEVSNSAGTVKSLKATLYVSDYVFPFTDVYANDWFYADVKNANQLKLIDGKTPTLFKPYDNMTYAEAIKLAACMNQVYNTGTVTLKNGSPWYQSYVDYAKTHGIPWNYPDYNAAITRKDYVYIFYSALPASDYKAINSIGMASIPDVGPSTFASTEILAFYNAGILTGYTDGSFAPDRNIERSEVATILSRMMDHNARKSFSL